ncbi:scf e3 ubiquitin ligase complex f-box protein grra [Moniliophthora roreri MCA 2997]|uniref:Scf e3 ubiquitin ligase complex f-box protein grra n=1 Tax=Moniliophthora roreri (strain MCA 2997) TaxID=1381753 RepID=V2YRY5_MONRO|nr:scf e3 ubiquitin ligase complex f-box protein grra [Moniliophthora roreri MCA 2997]
MLYKRPPSTTSLSDDEGDDGDTKFTSYDHKTNFAVAPAHWTPRSGLPHSYIKSPMSSLPPEILIHILKHLQSPRDIYNSLQVSRTWCECSVELLWHKPTLNKVDPLLKLTKLLASPRQTFTYASFIRRLNFLSIGQELKDDTFSVLSKCDRLERLTLVGCSDLSTNTLSRVLPSFPNLVAIDLTGVENTSDKAIIGLASVAKRLQGINLGGCKNVSGEGVFALAKNCPLLRRVKLSGLETLTDKPVSALAKSCPFLLEIDLNSCKLITDHAIRDIWTYSTHMREMKLSHCPELTDAAFPAPLKRDKAPTTDTPNPFPLSNTQAADSGELEPLVITRTFEHLRMLDLTACSLVTDDAIEGIVSHAPKIRNLVLNKCSLLTDRSVENICKLGRHLHYLHLGHTSKITDKSVRTLARSCTRLRYVDFANCVLLTDMAVFELSALPKLRRVGLVRVSNLTDEAIYALAERHATLERIHLSYCDQISVMAIHFLLQKLHKLTHLSLTGVPAFRQPELQQFCREPPPDFSTTQQSAFCVYSGKGVSQLRAFLTELFDRITEMNGTDDTEYEDEEYDPDVYHEDTPEPEINGEGEQDEEEDFISRRMLPSIVPAALSQRPHTEEDLTRLHQRPAAVHRPPSANSASDVPFLNHVHGVARVNNQITIPIQSPGAGSSRRPRGHTTTGFRSLADALPVVETTNSPPPSDVASNFSGGTHRSNGAGFFRNYRDSGNGSARNSGVMTPDLNFAEIGHGRGVQPQSIGVNNVIVQHPMRRTQGHNHPHHRTPIVEIDSTATSTPSTSGSAAASSSALAAELRTPQPAATQYQIADVDWPYREPTSPPLGESSTSLSQRELQESVHSALSGTASDPRGRSVKRSLRNTLTAAEHYASSLLFGRSPTRNHDDGPGPSSAGASSSTSRIQNH